MSSAFFDFYGLRENPFGNAADARHIFMHGQARTGWNELVESIQRRKGLFLLSGEAGTGKTTLLRSLLEWLRNRNHPAAFLFHSRLDTTDLIELVLADLGVKCNSRAQTDQLIALNHWVRERREASLVPVLIFDEAQGLSSAVLEEIRLLIELETVPERRVQVILAGQPEIEERLSLPELRHIRERISAHCRTSAFTLEETRGYIEERLRRAGACEPQLIFSPEAAEALHRCSSGILRVLNILCEHSLIQSFSAGNKRVLRNTVVEVASQFQFSDAPCLLGEGTPRFPAVSLPDTVWTQPQRAWSARSELVRASELSLPEPLFLPRSMPSRPPSASASPPAQPILPSPAHRKSVVKSPLGALCRDMVSRSQALVRRVAAWLSEPLRKPAFDSGFRSWRPILDFSLRRDWRRLAGSVAQWLRAPATSRPPKHSNTHGVHRPARWPQVQASRMTHRSARKQQS